MTDFDSIFRKYHHPLFLYTLKFIEDENEALDLVQDIFITVWKKGIFWDNVEQIKAYLFVSVKNSCFNYLNHQKVVSKFKHYEAQQLKEIEAAHYASGEISLIEQEEVKLIEDVVASMPDIYKEVIVLSRFEGLKNSEIAKKLNIPLRTVETRIFRALLILKEKVCKKSFFIQT
ncbi:MAG: RNA polymerase sigma-70 factor [Bacteroidia bacterium]|nr:RNA polymerase sigma-70 factor [Bacteroidia bacterium]